MTVKFICLFDIWDGVILGSFCYADLATLLVFVNRTGAQIHNMHVTVTQKQFTYARTRCAKKNGVAKRTMQFMQAKHVCGNSNLQQQINKMHGANTQIQI